MHELGRELNQTLGGVVFEAIPTIQAQIEKTRYQHKLRIREEAAIFLMKLLGSWVAFLLVRLAGHAHAFWGGIDCSSSWLPMP